ncbi:hypothetical protein [Tenacibaculum xiamenense]|uniref:hypothetical protein n=1 Tax=Tenacibaculum xiamenense TaxID=1261553 RepID=UPI003895B66F
MEDKVYINQLMMPVWPLYNVEKIIDVKYNDKSAKRLSKVYSQTQLNNIYNALSWADKNPNYNFLEIMKDAPTPRKLKFSNKEIYKHLINFKKFMEDFGLIEDDN